ncbi:MAG: spiro-SPASM protein [Treponemataceae bacterium]|nr:spiro-SPASM protein [Treponemataceae bacterium]
MKTLVILFADFQSLHAFDPIFDGASAFERALSWAEAAGTLSDSAQSIVVLADPQNQSDCERLAAGFSNVDVRAGNFRTAGALFSAVSDAADEYGADTVALAWADLPFLDAELTRTLLDTHGTYLAEYTFADGYPYGFAPEILNAGTARILAELAASRRAADGVRPVSRTALFDFIKPDINSFEVETVIAPEDWRLYRMSFDCGTKAGAAACSALFTVRSRDMPLPELCRRAASCVNIIKTLPSYYGISITDACTAESLYLPAEMQRIGGQARMSAEQVRSIADGIAAFSESAVVSLSAWGEPLLHPQFSECAAAVLAHPGLSLLVETDGLHVTEAFCGEMKALAGRAPERRDGGSGCGKITWIVRIDASTPELYGALHGSPEGFSRAVAAVSLLSASFPGDVYPQFVRMNENEEELEPFFRFWSAKDSPSGGRLIIQKYDSCCGVLPDRKPADLSPLERNPCWHIRRDMTILPDGSVPLCRCRLRGSLAGNVFESPLEEIWRKLTPEVQAQMDGTYSEKCRKCDEFYTFNF